MRDAFFYALCAALLGLAGTTVLARNLFRAALALLGVLLCTAVLFLLLRAEMVALVQVMVYIGGIMIFVLYAVLLTSELGGRMASPSPLKMGAAVAVAAVALGFLAGLAMKAGPGFAAGAVSAGSGAAGIASMKSLGGRLLDTRGFLIPFELISVLLLAAMVGAIAVARPGKDGKAGKPGNGASSGDARGGGAQAAISGGEGGAA
ncbi:MAG TPA: NADH-quinone oxidoreductase subunit J [Fibrobacteria bacterium]|nr:NADH-quinone oxidoreductase subunit J [Fibrobacteria bacterium]